MYKCLFPDGSSPLHINTLPYFAEKYEELLHCCKNSHIIYIKLDFMYDGRLNKSLTNIFVKLQCFEHLGPGKYMKFVYFHREDTT